MRAVAALAKGLGMETTAEGVETEHQLATVKLEGCTEMQGFLFSRPRPASEITEMYFPNGRDRVEEQSEAAWPQATALRAGAL